MSIDRSPETNFPTAWQPALKHSHFLRHLLGSRPAIAAWLEANADAPVTAATMQAFLETAAAQDDGELKGVLRNLRQRTMAALIVRDLTGQANLAEVVETMTALADTTTNFALDFIHRQLAAQYGEPLDASGLPQRLMIVGMGKLGGRELNVSSDVDYIFIYPEEGETAGVQTEKSRIDNYDFFNRLGKRLISALGEATEDGQVFRVDMRLRPNGDSGPLVCSLDSLENYFITQGREWERYAWIKARVMNEGDNLQPAWKTALEKITRPFIFRKYLDFGAINAMRDLHAQIRREVARKDMADHIKLGPGGIREIEFIAQVFQLIRGGRDSALQIRPTLKVLDLLAARQLLPQETRDELTAAYDFLRRLEHRLQYVDDAQTHMLPEDAEARAPIAESMGYPDWTALLAALDTLRENVSRHFGLVFSDPEAGIHPLAGLWLGQCGSESCHDQLGELGFSRPQEIIEQLDRFRGSSRYVQLPAANRERLDAVGPRLIQAAAATATPDITFTRALGFLETISRRGAYLALLQQHPQALSKVAELVGAATWAAEYLNKHPILLDEILDPRLYDIATDWSAFRESLAAQLAEYEGDAEREMDILREAHHAQVFRVLAQDLAGLQTLEHISDHLTELADIVVQTTLKLVWPKIRQRHCDTPKFAVIGYGKMGGKELGYGSDLDIVFLYDDADQSAQENYTRLAQRTNTWLSSQTSAGILFETDLRLRPNGDSGLLASTVEAFRDYELNHAWIWEHQALTRARFVAGDPAVGQRFEAIREEILMLPRDPAKLKEEVLAMRQRMLDAHASKSETTFDLKQDPGGIIDVEFIVQYLILGHAHAHRELTKNLGNIALLGLAADLGLIAHELADPVRNAYREYRRMQHAARLS
ncbi:MAG: bifunctional [glutamate--ammonia ligase]-adenylyl-L-tyrosine phosphorylase/[glutamate--ammonia-ligase] adenylyltransferase, partial [Rhodocyclaceae bacterium]